MTEPKRPYIIQDPVNRLTIGIKLDAENRVYAAVALCNPVDQYVRRVGFAKVTGMLASPKLKPLGVYTGSDWKQEILPLLKDAMGVFNDSMARRRYYLCDPTCGWDYKNRAAFRASILDIITMAVRKETLETLEVTDEAS